tara:strand:- start:169 stop:369 length:201 start_codon:yes stop_codon:yes gene_type:complete
MKVGDLVKYGEKMYPNGTAWLNQSKRVGIVVGIHHRVVPTALVKWNGIESVMPSKIDLLEVVSEGR